MDTLRRILTVLAETAASPKRSNRVHLPANDLECCQASATQAGGGYTVLLGTTLYCLELHCAAWDYNLDHLAL